MADLTMCPYKDCERSSTCYRFNAPQNIYRQSFLAEPKKDCADQDYSFYIKQ